MICIRPNYFSKFQCDGKACGSRCCKGWRVVVDSNTYEKYFNIADEGARQSIISHLEKLDDNNYFVKMRDNFDCPFLDGDSLCKIQKYHGEDYLTAICYSYPRVNYILGEVLEQSLTLTCPIAAPLILLPTEPMQFEEIDIEKPRGIFDWTSKLKKSIEESVDMQAKAISILQNRNFPLNERLIYLCLHLQDEPFVGKINLNFDIDKHADVMIDIFCKMYEMNMDSEKKANLKQMYITYKEVILERLMVHYSHIFENYLVNEFFMRCYPFAFDGGLWTNCKIFITGYKAMEFAIILMAISKNGFVTVEEFLNMIDAINEKLDHNRGGMEAIIKFAKSSGDIQNFSIYMFDK